MFSRTKDEEYSKIRESGKREEEDRLSEIEKETTNFIVEYLRLTGLGRERDGCLENLDENAEKLELRSRTFGKSVKATSSRLRRKFIRNLVIAMILVLLFLGISFSMN